LKNVGKTVVSTDTGMNTTMAVEKKTEKYQRRTHRTAVQRINRSGRGKGGALFSAKDIQNGQNLKKLNLKRKNASGNNLVLMGTTLTVKNWLLPTFVLIRVSIIFMLGGGKSLTLSYILFQFYPLHIARHVLQLLVSCAKI